MLLHRNLFFLTNPFPHTHNNVLTLQLEMGKDWFNKQTSGITHNTDRQGCRCRVWLKCQKIKLSENRHNTRREAKKHWTGIFNVIL